MLGLEGCQCKKKKFDGSIKCIDQIGDEFAPMSREPLLACKTSGMRNRTRGQPQKGGGAFLVFKEFWLKVDTPALTGQCTGKGPKTLHWATPKSSKDQTIRVNLRG